MPKRLLGILPVAVFVCVCATIPAPAQRGGAAPVVLPDGNGKEMVTALCSGCHNLNMITTGWGYDRQDWDSLIASMVALPPDVRATVSTYLGTHFSEKKRPATVVVPGTASVDIKEWVVPSLGSRPPTPLAPTGGPRPWCGGGGHNP